MKCFYCNTGGRLALDRFFPRVLAEMGFPVPLDAEWNIVSACHRCIHSKANRVPSIRLVEQLSRRNEALTGEGEESRPTFLQSIHTAARGYLLRETWDPMAQLDQ